MARWTEYYEAQINLQKAINRYYKACQATDIDDRKFCEYFVDAVMSSTETEDNSEGVILSDYIN